MVGCCCLLYPLITYPLLYPLITYLITTGGPTKVRHTSGGDFVFDIYGTGFNSLDEGWGLGTYCSHIQLCTYYLAN